MFKSIILLAGVLISSIGLSNPIYIECPVGEVETCNKPITQPSPKAKICDKLLPASTPRIERGIACTIDVSYRDDIITFDSMAEEEGISVYSYKGQKVIVVDYKEMIRIAAENGLIVVEGDVEGQKIAATAYLLGMGAMRCATHPGCRSAVTKGAKWFVGMLASGATYDAIKGIIL